MAATVGLKSGALHLINRSVVVHLTFSYSNVDKKGQIMVKYVAFIISEADLKSVSTSGI